MEKHIKNQGQGIVENFSGHESAKKMNWFKEKCNFCGYANTPAGEQLVYEILKLIRKNNLSISDADSVLDVTHEVIKYVSLNQPLRL